MSDGGSQICVRGPKSLCSVFAVLIHTILAVYGCVLPSSGGVDSDVMTVLYSQWSVCDCTWECPLQGTEIYNAWLT